MAKSLEQLRKGAEFIAWAEKKGARVRRAPSSHAIVGTDLGAVVVPCHAKELGKGIRIKIVKVFIAIGLGALGALVLFAH
jgi:hypothetical protein